MFLIFFLIALIAAVGLISQNSTIQTYLAQEVVEAVSEEFDVNIDIKKCHLSGLRSVNLIDVNILDHHLDTMISVSELEAGLSLKNIFTGNTLYLTNIILQKPSFYLHKTSSDTAFNINYFVKKLSSEKPDSLKTDLKVVLEDLKMYEGRFELQFDTIVNASRSFNPEHIIYQDIHASIPFFSVHKDTVQGDIDTLLTTELPISKEIRIYNTALNMNQHLLNFANLDLHFGNSHVGDSLSFAFQDWSRWKNFSEEVVFNCNLKNALLRSQDLQYFFPQLDGQNHTFRIGGELSGRLSDLNLRNFDIRYGSRSYAKGNLSIEGLPVLDNSMISLNVKNSRLTINDFSRLLPADILKQTQNLQYLDLKGKFDGFYYDFVADGIFNTALGMVKTDINFKVPDEGLASYSGNLSTQQFQLGKLLDREEIFQTINLNAEIEGFGLSAHTADVEIKASLNNSSINNYEYELIQFDAELREYLFDGLLSVRDTALNLDVNGLINLDPEIEKIDIKGKISHVQLDAINLTEKEGLISGTLDLDFNKLSLDQTYGHGDLKDVSILYDDKYLFIDTLSITSELNENFRNINIMSDLVNANIQGNFRLRTLFADLQNLWFEYQLQLVNNQDSIDFYYDNKQTTGSKYSASWYLDFKDVNPIASLFLPNLYISQDARVNGKISMGKTRIFNVFTSIDTIFYDQYHFYENEIDISSSKFADSSRILAFVLLDSKKQEFVESLDGRTLHFEGVWDNRNIEFETYFEQYDDSNYVKLNGNAVFEIDSTILTFNRSDYKIYSQNWNIEENNQIIIHEDQFRFENLSIASESESIWIDGLISRKPEDKLKIHFADFNLRNFKPLVNREVSGVLNAKLTLNNIYNQPQLFGDLSANDCTIEGFLLGDISGSTLWDNTLKALISEYKIDRLGENILEIEGQILPKEDYAEFNMVAQLHHSNLNLIEPFTTGILSDIDGKADGYLRLSGTNERPILQGRLNLENGAITADYLNTRYTFEDQLIFNSDNIYADKVILKDQYGNNAILEGGIYHDGFTNLILDLDCKLEKFHILNTDIDDNNLYYGTAYGSGDLNFLGAFSDIKITADLKSEKGTFVHIPLDNYTELEKETHITFLSEIDNTEKSEIFEKEEIDLSGISMNLNLDMDESAQMEIILDRQTGDIIKGNGKGQLSLEIDTRGDFNMYGFYEIEKGSYNFTLLNIVNKEFRIKKGGRISWAGDPYQGILDLTGTYAQNVSLKPLMLTADSTFLSSPQAARRHPVDVNLKLTGPLLSPQFAFDILVQDPPTFQGYDFNNDFLAFQNRIRNNEFELNREVFSLIVLRQFSQNQAALQQSAGTNLSELFTNQLSTYLSSVNENLEINFDLSGLSQEDLQNLQLRLSYTFLDGRLRVTREGGFTNSANESNVSNIIGDWTIEYGLTQDGRLKAKMFNRNNPNIYQSGTSTTTRGVSLLYTRSFDEFIELITKEKSSQSSSEKNSKKNRKMSARQEEQNDKKLGSN